MNFDNLSYEELDQSIMARLVLGDAVRSTILNGHLFIENVLETLISNALPNPGALFKSNRRFALKVDLARAMNLVDDKCAAAFKALNNMRNKCAHAYDYEVSLGEIKNLKVDWEDDLNQAIDIACKKSAEEAVTLATIFLSWYAMWLIKKPKT